MQHGYRLLDTANGYGNEEHVGRAIRDSGIPRSEIYLTTKLANTDHHRVREAFEASLQALNVEYIDLYLVHWPQAQLDGAMGDPDGTVPKPGESPTFIDTWKEMEKLLDAGSVKSIGVSNFSILTLGELLPHCNVIPAVNQVELHPCLPQFDLKEFCDAKGILLEAYSPLGQKSMVLHDDSVIGAIAAKLHATPAQIVLSWGVQRGTAVVAKTENEERMVNNITVIRIPDEDMAVIDRFHERPGMHRSLVWARDTDEVFGWKYEWLGWGLAKGGAVSSEHS
ncbi:hypothetical protein HGRIS_011570 [Hohenbuehelia grisea]|uniref:NADP-dependent oxidoreductase domain-containing protein n=1 Tax=Hohenbuehelia grisea TaxID=104357 RepID=A0ABR3JXJ2_9AGAR